MKAIITDLDRTLLRTDKTLSPYTIDILRTCHRAGILVMAATARPERNVTEYHEQIHFDAMTVTNGAIILLPNCEIINGLLKESAEKILTGICEHPDIVLSVETSSGFYASEDIPSWEPIIYNDFPSLPTDVEVYKILVSSKHDSIFSTVEVSLTEDSYHTVAGGNLIQIMSRRATKWNGIKAMLKAFDVSPEETVYFGDDNDDIEAIRRCGTGVAVANAIEPVRAAADAITESNDEDGVARYILRYILNEK